MDYFSLTSNLFKQASCSSPFINSTTWPNLLCIKTCMCILFEVVYGTETSAKYRSLLINLYRNVCFLEVCCSCFGRECFKVVGRPTYNIIGSFSQESYLVNPPSRTFRMHYAILQCNRSNCNSNWLGFYLQNFFGGDILITSCDCMGGANAERRDFAKGAQSDV